jgi:hypothetical protein
MRIQLNWRTTIIVCIVALRFKCLAADNPSLSAPMFGIRPGATQLSLTNSSDTNFQYVVQTSSNLQDWVSVTTNFATGPDSPVTVPAPLAGCFYRLMEIPHVPVPVFRYAILTSGDFNGEGNNFLVDSFDSSDALHSLLGQYNAVLRKAGGDVATDSTIIGDTNSGNGNIYGHLYTGIGATEDSIQIGPNGAVGSAMWNTANVGIQPGYWSGSFYINFPDVTGPSGGTTSLPSPSNGVVTLKGGTYVVPPNDPNVGIPLLISAPTTLWVQGSYSPPAITIAITNSASLALYVGRSSGSGDRLTMYASYIVNQPGIARFLQIYGLPSLTNLVLQGNSGFTGCIYAPEADVIFESSGSSSTDTCGSIVAKSLTLVGHQSFHFDENLKVNGPVF